jgi:hypothetical protein
MIEQLCCDTKQSRDGIRVWNHRAFCGRARSAVATGQRVTYLQFPLNPCRPLRTSGRVAATETC